MLVLSRKEGEHIQIGPNVKVTIVSIHGNKVRIGITAPKDVAIHRQEIMAKDWQDCVEVEFQEA